MSTATDLLDDYRWLVGGEAADILNEPFLGEGSTVRAADRLRTHLSPSRARLILEQVELRRRAARKFTAAGRMFFTPAALAQATDEHVAAYKARRFAPHPRVADLCCGIGGDLVALARAGEAVGAEVDPVVATLAAANARVVGCGDKVSVRCTDAATFDVTAVAAWHIDPDRRPEGRRTTRPESHRPSAAEIDRLLAANPHAAVKLAPAARASPAWQQQAESEWIRHDRECRQLVLWFGALAHAPGRRRATAVGGNGSMLGTFVGDPQREVPPTERFGRFLVEPDPAVIAARLTGALAQSHGLAAPAPGIAYLTSERRIDHALVTCFEIDEVLPYRPKLLAAWFRRRRIGRLEVKKRGVRLDPAHVERQLRGEGDDARTLLLLPWRGKTTALIARRATDIAVK